METDRLNFHILKENFKIVHTPKTNFEMEMGDGQANILWVYHVEKTLVNRIKYWFFFQFFPFKLKRWDK